MSRFWVYSNPARKRVLIHRQECPACEGGKPYLLNGRPERACAWEPAESYKEARGIAEAMTTAAHGLRVTACAICAPG
jgi:hypothetical protein